MCQKISLDGLAIVDESPDEVELGLLFFDVNLEIQNIVLNSMEPSESVTVSGAWNTWYWLLVLTVQCLSY